MPPLARRLSSPETLGEGCGEGVVGELIGLREERGLTLVASGFIATDES